MMDGTSRPTTKAWTPPPIESDGCCEKWKGYSFIRIEAGGPRKVYIERCPRCASPLYGSERKESLTNRFKRHFCVTAGTIGRSINTRHFERICTSWFRRRFGNRIDAHRQIFAKF